MSTARNTVGQRLAHRLGSAETAVDAALAEVAALTALLPAARQEAWLSAVSGQRAFDGAAGAVGALTQARAHLIQTHNTLAALGRKLGVDVHATGPIDKPDTEPPVGGASPELIEFSSLTTS